MGAADCAGIKLKKYLPYLPDKPCTVAPAPNTELRAITSAAMMLPHRFPHDLNLVGTVSRNFYCMDVIQLIQINLESDKLHQSLFSFLAVENCDPDQR